MQECSSGLYMEKLGRRCSMADFEPRWEDPGPSRTGRAKHWDLAKTRPGEWLLAKESHPVSHGYKTAWLKSHGFEIAARNNGDGTYRLYVRYIGDTNDS